VNVLLLVDLEGVAGVDDVESLLEGSAGFPRAQELLAGEIEAACAGLNASRVLISDSHRGGPSPTVLRARLPRGAELLRTESGYDFSPLSQVQAVACLGMHAGVDGFVPHTVDLSCVWEADGRTVSETDLLLGVAAERGVPALFVAGDDSLDARGLPFVATKHALSSTQARSRPVEEVRRELQRAAASKPVPAPALPGGLRMCFRSAWMAEVAERAGGARVGETVIRLDGPNLEARIAQGDAFLRRTGELLAASLRPWALAEDAGTLAARPFSRRPPALRSGEARRALESFLEQTHDGEQELALRALTLHMLEGHAPRFFAAQQLGPVLDASVAALRVQPFDAPHDEQLMMARLDAVYVLRERGRKAEVDAGELQRCIAQVFARDPIWGWLLGELAHQLGLPGRVTLADPRPFRRTHRLADLYWLTHLFLLETRYLHRPLPRPGFEAMTEEVLLAAPSAVAQGELDVAAELAFCMVVAGEANAPEHEHVLSALSAAQQRDGRVGDAHGTAAALLAFASAA
jgi:D-amino peptidase